MSTTWYNSTKTRTLAVAIALTAGTRARADENQLQYNRDIRPILFANCVSCHGPDSATRQADLRVDRRESVVDMGAIAPGDPDASEMIRRIFSEDPAEQMPPPETKKTLTAKEKATLVRWIQEGAKYQPHWSFIPPERPSLPEVKNSWWVRNPIDRFVAARLESEGLAPAAEADRRTLARRLSLDLTGLPPSPEVVNEFVNDAAPDAYERYVDRLMATPPWGEHRGRHWLDAARYADTHGIHFDNFREMWSYRDWVIAAFNANMPFDEFTVENLAGDLLPEATLEQQIGSGFNRCNITTSEGGAIDEEYAVLYTRDRTETTSQVWMGLTAGCAVCHDHKFDPMTQKEFYELSAFFNNTTQAAMDGNVRDTPPVITAPLAEDHDRWAALQDRSAELEALLADRHVKARQGFDAWVASATPEEFDLQIPSDALDLHAPMNASNGEDSFAYSVQGNQATASRPSTVEWTDGRFNTRAARVSQGAAIVIPNAGDFERDQAFSCTLWVKLPENDGADMILARVDEGPLGRGWDLWVESRQIGAHLTHDRASSKIKVVTKEQFPAHQWLHVSIVYDGSGKGAGFTIYVDGKERKTSAAFDTLSGTIRTKEPLKIGVRKDPSPLSGVAVEDVRIYRRALRPYEAASFAAMALVSVLVESPQERSPEQLDALFEWWLVNRDETYRKLTDEVDAVDQEKKHIAARGTVAHVMRERDEPPIAYVLNRGEYDQRLEEVGPGTPAFLPPLPDDLPRNRLGVAQWLVRPEHPLTARVTVNRFWQELFGTGLVKTAGDFGVTGEWPSHPELLDWLAVEFRESGWDVKRLFKLMVTSAVYRQAAVMTPGKRRRDPDNRLLSRGPRFRMDAEMVRDYALEAAGLLSRQMGGPSVKPYQPSGVWESVAMFDSNTYAYKQDSGESLYRRSVYTFWKRSAPPASMDAFNAPSREQCTLCRERTNTPLQALVTLNDPQFIEAARNLAQQTIERAGAGVDDRMTFIAQRALARTLTDDEAAALRATVDQLVDYYQAHADDAKQLIAVGETQADGNLNPMELAAWTMLASEVLNLDEAINK